MSLIFKKPTLDDKESTLKFVQSYLSYYNETGIHGGAELEKFNESNFDEWLNYVRSPAGTNTFGYDKVADDTFLILKNDIVVGIVHVRYDLNEFLLHIGGHIGYSTHPDFQGQGIAKNALAYALSVLKNKGINKTLITCYDNNIGSAKVIEANGGILENTVQFGNQTVRRYWVSL